MMSEITISEINDLFESVYKTYGYDFREYNPDHLKRRLINRMALSQIGSFGELKRRVIAEPVFSSLIFKDLSIQVTEMFRDSSFYEAFRASVIPFIKTYPFVKIWQAGIASGEEVYSIAILLREENLYDKCMIYATDFNQHALEQGMEGVYPESKIKKYIRNYQQAGGKASLSDYIVHDYNRIIINSDLRKNIVWANHNLVTDKVFSEVNIILCRNVMIYFNKELQEKVHALFLESLANGGFLCLGMNESFPASSIMKNYSTFDVRNKIFKKKYRALSHMK
ncbi:protein-glutamate O-methyltransferase CheR [Sporocytophaga myxococcoides]|uniref:Protein-glutamate O-methyltransferase CheR n=1 Tax=Sporocytophaga myxococcoides TaxID=153721 RepID=A0A098L8K3_9BACT|nr:protein-glutamate O-methyltransferase CheR [Sporocytophaga myxococcoides]GAL83145.1 protein-glutamate O-methyltransferase CheR [Sporocytophaga myxococcoides]